MLCCLLSYVEAPAAWVPRIIDTVYPTVATLLMLRLKQHPFGVVWKSREGFQLMYHPRHMTKVQNYEVITKNPRVAL
ncbi:hypothetical protein TNCV_4660821 [Trichonephila clavipes]|uniref:Uncharacterized protein n=1 Tax=Trichonephila clavipes TaxID=2585209 RepID=A0A8X6SCK3_TRICX|nr:hypothetical protein TNCV_4660821 [Trichonephila clavipes]